MTVRLIFFVLMIASWSALAEDFAAVQGLIHYSEQLGDSHVQGTGLYYRDSVGRVRQEANGQIQVFDPTDQVSWNFDRRKNTVVLTRFQGQASSPEPKESQIGDVHKGLTRRAVRAGSVSEQDLGTREIYGLSCHGRKGRTTVTAPGEPAQTVVEYEVWYSKELLLPCSTVVTSSAGYRQELSYVHVVVDRLNRDLFELPEGANVVDSSR